MNMQGNITKADPITDPNKIIAIKEILRDNPRNFALFVVGINTGFRASDLVAMKVSDFRGKKVGEKVAIREQKTKKVRTIILSQAVYDAVQPLLTGDDSKPLFRNADGGKLAVESVIRLVKSWCAKVGLKGNYSSHTLRKTWAHHMYKAGVNECDLSEALGHASVKQTRIYLGIQPADVEKMYMIEV